MIYPQKRWIKKSLIIKVIEFAYDIAIMCKNEQFFGIKQMDEAYELQPYAFTRTAAAREEMEHYVKEFAKNKRLVQGLKRESLSFITILSVF
ncbi:MAG TPA: hypothetical protein VD770_04230 [Coxiellaceae bacterium]|nr:hypothetical protein [Coxiellaceae bacterium]